MSDRRELIMKQIVIARFGNADCLEMSDAPAPLPGPDELTINVAYAGVGYVDVLMRRGAFDFVRPPTTPGIEVSGVVRDVGKDISAFKSGDRVAALLTDFSDGGLGGYAEVAKAKGALTVHLTAEDDLATCAATIVNGATAFMAVDERDAGSSIAVTGASGGLGQCVLAAAHSAGATEIIAVSRNSERVETLKRLGATRVVTPQEFIRVAPVLDAAFDTVGGPVRASLMTSLKDGGRLVLLGNASGEDASLSGDAVWLRSLRVEGLSTGGLSPIHPDRVAAAAKKAIANARVRPTPFAVMSLDDAREAHRILESGRGPGKLVLRVTQ